MDSTRRVSGINVLHGWGRRAIRYVLAHDPSSWTGRAITWGPALGVMAGIFWLSGMSEPFGSDPFWFDDLIGVIGHFGEYGLLALAWRWALIRQWPDLRRPAWIALAVTLAFAFSDEYHQSFVPGRFPDLLDILTDLAGAVTALLLWGRGERVSG